MSVSAGPSLGKRVPWGARFAMDVHVEDAMKKSKAHGTRKGLKAHAFAMPVAVAINLELRYQHDALRDILWRMADQLEKRSVKGSSPMRKSLEMGQHVLDEVAMLVVALFGENVSVNVIMGVTTWEPLTVTSFAGEMVCCIKSDRRHVLVEDGRAG